MPVRDESSFPRTRAHWAFAPAPLLPFAHEFFQLWSTYQNYWLIKVLMQEEGDCLDLLPEKGQVRKEITLQNTWS